MKVLAIDYGQKRVGLALGDTETKLALPFGTLEKNSQQEIVEHLKQLVSEEEIAMIVVGEPITLAGGESEQTKVSRQFAEILKRELVVEVILMDERLTSRQADAVALGAGAPTRNRDELAAMFLLQDYLDRNQSSQIPPP